MATNHNLHRRPDEFIERDEPSSRKPVHIGFGVHQSDGIVLSGGFKGDSSGNFGPMVLPNDVQEVVEDVLLVAVVVQPTVLLYAADGVEAIV